MLPQHRYGYLGKQSKDAVDLMEENKEVFPSGRRLDRKIGKGNKTEHFHEYHSTLIRDIAK